MKLADAREYYYTFSGKLSDVNRQLCFAGIAVVWIFAVSDDNGSYSLPSALISPLGMFVIGLTFDLLHYAVAAASWSLFHRIKERSGTDEAQEVGAPVWINYAPLALFWSKVFVTLVGYALLVRAVAS